MRLLTLLPISLAICLIGTAASAQVIHGCVKANGTLKVVPSPGTCGNNETPISWNQQGPPGNDGKDGQDGVDGVDGEAGPIGPSLRYLDATGAPLGIPYGTRRFFNEDIEASFSLDSLLAQDPFVALFFDSPGCAGQAYVDLVRSDLTLSTIFGPWPADVQNAPSPFPTWWVSQTNVASAVIESKMASIDVCEPTDTSSDTLVAVDPLPVPLPFAFPLLEPIYVGLSMD